jgi:hypothetical protein
LLRLPRGARDSAPSLTASVLENAVALLSP